MQDDKKDDVTSNLPEDNNSEKVSGDIPEAATAEEQTSVESSETIPDSNEVVPTDTTSDTTESESVPVGDAVTDTTTTPSTAPAVDTNVKTVSKRNAIVAGILALVAGGAIGYSAYGSLNNQVVVSGAGMSITKSEMTTHLTSSSSTALFDVAKSQALQKLYPQKVLSSDDSANKAANKLIDQYVTNNGGRKVLNASLKAQKSNYKKWHALMMPQAVTQAKAQAEAKQSLAVVKDAKVVKAADIKTAVENYRLYSTNAYMTKTEDDANKIADALKGSKDAKVDSKLYQQHQDGLRISSIDNNSDSTQVLAKLKDAKVGDVVTVQLASGSGYYVFQLKSSNSYADYKKNNDADGIKQINKAVTESLNQQAALSADTLGRAEAKVFKSKNIHFKKSSLDKQFYSSLTTSTSPVLSSGGQAQSGD